MDGKSKLLAKAKDQSNAMLSTFNPSTDNAKIKKDIIGIQYFSLACNGKAFDIIKGKLFVKKQLKLLQRDLKKIRKKAI